MNALTCIEIKQFGLASAMGKDLDFPKPFAKDILLTEFLVVGNTFGLTVDPVAVAEGVKLKLFRDTRNKYDKNSIVIKDCEDSRIGFVPMNKNEILARLLEAGKEVYAVVSKNVASIDGNVELTVKVFMEA